MEELGYILIVIGFIVVLLESYIPGLYFPALGIALIVYGIFLFIMPNYSLLAGFLAGIITVFLLYKFVYFSKNEYKVGVERLIGKEGIALEDFKDNYGKIKIENEVWHAKSEDDIKKGDKVIVIGYEGVHLIVKRV
ncbi:NfeD family protein [Methanocaldococcus indicus]|uniref:NfeD family protein n=1 Tax=Methanocaldococcus indicus TaxID=213231 RepID=UPI003C6CCE7D